MILIGIDCATEATRVGLARGRLEGERVVIDAACAGQRDPSIVQVLSGWLAADPAGLLALDAPLGWPRALAPALQEHRAGEPIPAPLDTLFSRATDRLVASTLRKYPFEVGANLIARTAYAALSLLAELRGATGRPIPLAWEPGQIDETAAIEVYPGATLRALGLRMPGYRKPAARALRQALLDTLHPALMLGVPTAALVANPHVLDAALCVLAAGDFLLHRCPPLDPALAAIARQEGWIWVRARAAPGTLKEEGS